MCSVISASCPPAYSGGICNLPQVGRIDVLWYYTALFELPALYDVGGWDAGRLCILLCPSSTTTGVERRTCLAPEGLLPAVAFKALLNCCCTFVCVDSGVLSSSGAQFISSSLYSQPPFMLGGVWGGSAVKLYGKISPLSNYINVENFWHRRNLYGRDAGGFRHPPLALCDIRAMFAELARMATTMSNIRAAAAARVFVRARRATLTLYIYCLPPCRAAPALCRLLPFTNGGGRRATLAIPVGAGKRDDDEKRTEEQASRRQRR